MGLIRAFSFISFLWLCSCSGVTEIKPNDPDFAPVIPPSAIAPPPNEGGLYTEGFGLSLFSNTNNHQIGDIITIMLDERTVSSKTSTTEIDKENNISLLEGSPGAETLFGKSLSKELPLVGDISIPQIVDQSREFSGEASADQSNSLQGSISVTVTDIMPNGNLVVRGEKWLTLNNGDEFIRITGILRADDITLNNTVSSTKLANARIAYSGTGDLANSQKMGWLTKFFNGPYWPF